MFRFARNHLASPEELFLSNGLAVRAGLKPALLTAMFGRYFL
jgi:hypothetical protein